MDAGRSPDRGPTFPSSAVAVVAALSAAAVLATGPLQFTITSVGGFGALVLLGGGYLRLRDHRLAAPIALAVGLVTDIVAVGLAAVYPAGPLTTVALVLGVLGPSVLAVGLVPLRRSWAGQLVALATASLLGAVVVRGVLSVTDRPLLLVAFVGTILAWDAGDHAVGLGAEVGRGASTGDVAVTHLLGSLVVGLVAVVAATGLYGIGPSSVPIVSVAALLTAVVVLLVALALGHVPAGDSVEI